MRFLAGGFVRFFRDGWGERVGDEWEWFVRDGGIDLGWVEERFEKGLESWGTFAWRGRVTS